MLHVGCFRPRVMHGVQNEEVEESSMPLTNVNAVPAYHTSVFCNEKSEMTFTV